MTDWDRVRRLRGKGASWDEIAEDRRVAFVPPAGVDAGRALKVLYLRKRSKARRAGTKGAELDSGSRGRLLEGWARHRTAFLSVTVATTLLGALIYLLVLSPWAPPPQGSTHA